MDQLLPLRKTVDAIDKKIIALLAQRAAIVKKI
jgi:chorismate mutase